MEIFFRLREEKKMKNPFQNDSSSPADVGRHSDFTRNTAVLKIEISRVASLIHMSSQSRIDILSFFPRHDPAIE